MHCRICDASLAEVHFNSSHGDIEPCMTCQIVIQDTLDGYLDQPSADEDAFGEEDPLAAYGCCSWKDTLDGPSQ